MLKQKFFETARIRENAHNQKVKPSQCCELFFLCSLLSLTQNLTISPTQIQLSPSSHASTSAGTATLAWRPATTTVPAFSNRGSVLPYSSWLRSSFCLLSPSCTSSTNTRPNCLSDWSSLLESFPSDSWSLLLSLPQMTSTIWSQLGALSLLLP